jgi:uncharacterized membrane protein
VDALTIFRLLHYLRTSLWPLPVACVLAGLAVSYATVELDDGTLIPQVYTGGPDAALAILATVAASMISLTGLVLTIVLVVVQLAMGQFSPRIVRSILYDRPSQIAIGVFVATFAHAMIAMRELTSVEAGAPVPGLAIIVAFVLVVVSIVVLVLYINHIGQSLRVAALIDLVGDETRALIDELYKDKASLATGLDDIIYSEKPGVVIRIDYDHLVQDAAAADCLLILHPVIGDFVPAGAPLFTVTGDTGRLDRADVIKRVALGPERTMNQDVAYGFRMLVDIAVRSLSDAYDPTTAVQAIDRLHDALRQLATRPFPSGEYRDEAGQLRLQVSHITWEGYVRLAFTEILEVGAGSRQTLGRLKAALIDLLTATPPERRPPLERLLAEVDAASQRLGDDGGEPVPADMQGIGSAADVVSPRP